MTGPWRSLTGRRWVTWLLLVPAGLLAVAAARGCGGGADAGAGSSTPVTFATGSANGVYYQYAKAFATAVSGRLGEVKLLETMGSGENLRRLRAGQATFAFTQADVAAGEQGGPPIRAVARLYDEYMHLVTRADAPVRTVADLRRLRVSVGPLESGTTPIADQILIAADLNPGRDIFRSRLSIDESVTALQDGRIDAFFWSGGLPTPAMSRLAAALPIRLVDLADAASQLRKRLGASYRTGTIPAGRYRGVDQPVTTVAVPNLLVTLASTPAPLVRAVVAALFDHANDLAASVPVADQLDARKSIFTEPIPLHDGAVAYFRSAKIQV